MRRVGVLGVGVGVFLADRLVERWALGHLTAGRPLGVWPPYVNLTLTVNTGAAFSLLRHQTWLFVAVAVLVVGAVAVWLARTRRVGPRAGWAAGLVAGGAAGNLWDRLVAGRVIDYVQVGIWPVFNLADAAIVVGMGLWLWESWARERRRASEI
ncbi:MAG: signal peptidase II [Actinomycetia bacterium]|nr:signal peptidase II [Actinomycetes bacterium]